MDADRVLGSMKVDSDVDMFVLPERHLRQLVKCFCDLLSEQQVLTMQKQLHLTQYHNLSAELFA